MAAGSPYSAPMPPPPPVSGNRKNMHVVGGATTNAAYTPGANLLAARQGYQSTQRRGGAQNALNRGRFQNTAEAPDFSRVHINQLQAGQGLATGQGIGNTLHNFALGNIRAANAPQGLGFGRSNALGAVRQHTLTGNEALDPGVTYTPLATPPPPPPTAAPPVPPIQSTENPAVPLPPSGTSPMQDAIQSNGGKGTETIASPTNITAQKLAGQRVTYDPAVHVGRVELSDGMFAPLVKTPSGGTAIDPTWQVWMEAAGVTTKTPTGSIANQVTSVTNPNPWAVEPTAPAPTTPTNMYVPPATTPAPTPVASAPTTSGIGTVAPSAPAPTKQTMTLDAARKAFMAANPGVPLTYKAPDGSIRYTSAWANYRNTINIIG